MKKTKRLQKHSQIDEKKETEHFDWLDDYWTHDAYRKGHYEIFRGNGENLFYYNVNSLYSYVMKVNDYPVTASNYFDTKRFKEGYLGIYKICIKEYKPRGLPIVTIRDENNEPLFVEGENFVVTLTSNEIEYALSNSYVFDFKVLKGIFFTKKDKLFKKAIYNEEKFLKLVTSSEFATKEKKKRIIYTEDDDIISQNLDKVAIINGKVYLIEWIDTDIVIASFITANARIEMIKKANTLLEAGFDVYYMNADGIITNASPEAMKKLGIKIDENKLGAMKVKCRIEHFEGNKQTTKKELPRCLPDSAFTKKFKLMIELVPQTLFNKSLYNYLKGEQWEKLKQEVYQREGRRCYICGAINENHYDLHEFWDYDDENHVQTLLELHHLCKMCHKVKHYGFWCSTADGLERLKEEGLTCDDIVRHFCKVNQCTEQDFKKHAEEAFALWHERNRYNWKQNLGKYQYLVTEEYRKSDEELPSQVTDRYWVYAYRKVGYYPENTENSGKWLIFVNFDKLDETWLKIKQAVEEGKLGNSAKAGTALYNSNIGENKTKVICVYTYDWTDEEDVIRIREELRKLGITWKIPYKADKDTIEGNYRKDGKKRISKYYI